MTGARVWAAIVFVVVMVACVPRLSPITGAPVPARLPAAAIPPGHHQIVFDWVLDDRELSAQGQGAARIAAPDSVRLDFFLAGGFGSGGAVLIRDSLRTPGGAASDFAARLVPPPALLWAALGRLAVPALPDTVARLDGAVLRADIGQPVAWRVTFHGDTLVRTERVENGRVAEWVERLDSARVRYRNERARRSLQLTITRKLFGMDFDVSIWRFDR